ncbi:hypothetical protein CFE70_003059 [Pyrenophora teres f. teres 0-1]
MAGVPPIVYPPESSASQQVPTPSESYQPSTAQERHESEMAKVLQIMASMASRSATPEVRTEYFEHWLKECQARIELSTMEYLQEFYIRSRRCVEAAIIEESRRGFYLVKGLLLR